MALIYAKDLEGRYLFYNGTFARAFVLDERAADEGTSAAEVLLGRDDSWLDPELQPVWRANDLRAREGSYYVEEWSDHPEHGRLYYDSIKFPLTDAKDVVYAVGGVSLDVTESRSAAVEVDRQRALLAEAQRIAAVGSWYVDLPDGAPVWSEEMRRILGVGPDASPPDVEGYVHQVVAEDRERVRVELGAAFLQGWEGESDHRFQRADGRVVHVHSQLRCDRAVRSTVVRISGTTQDVTDRKHIEAELQRERRLLAEAQAVGRVGSWEWRLDTGEPRWSDEQYRLHGLEPGAPIPPPDRFGELLHPDDRARVADEMAAKFSRPEDFEVEYRVQHGDFGPRTLLIRGGRVELEDGEGPRMAGTCRDVTAERQAEAQRQKTEGELRRGARYFELSRDLLVTAGFDGYFKQVNRAWSDAFGWSEEEMSSRPFLDFVHPDDQGATDTVANDLAAGGTVVSFENRYRAKDGTYRWLDWSAIGDPGEERIFASARDITERRLTERYTDARHEATRLLAEAATIEEALPVLLEVVGTRMDWPVGSFWVPTPGAERAATEIRCAAFWHEPSTDPSAYRTATESVVLEPGKGLAGRVLQTRRPRWVPDITAEPDANASRAEGARQDGLHACVLLPILNGEEVVAVMELVSPAVLPEDPVQMEILESLSRQVSEFFERERAKAALERLSRIDSLTGLHNRRHIEEVLNGLVSAARRHDHGFAVLLADIDCFKEVNDSHGHRVGDEVLCATADTIVAALRTEDCIARWGGEEFLVALPGQDAKGAAAAAERIRAAVATAAIETSSGLDLAVTVTLGGAVWAGDSVEEIVQHADAALYRGKAAGRDTVEIGVRSLSPV